jgi:hypothetical protein
MSALLCRRGLTLAVLLGVSLAPGCAKSVPLSPVSGKVTVDNQPVTSGQVTLIPLEETASAKSAGLSAGSLDAEGNYTITTGGKKGAPLGKYKVTVTPVMVPVAGATGPPTAPFNKVYQDAQATPLQIEVVENPEAGRYDLKLNK